MLVSAACLEGNNTRLVCCHYILSDPCAVLDEPFSFSTIRHKSPCISLFHMQFCCTRKKFKFFHHCHFLLHHHCYLEDGESSIDCVCLKREKLITVQANYLKKVVSQSPAYVIGRYESSK